jgi:hypothetical protein
LFACFLASRRACCRAALCRAAADEKDASYGAEKDGFVLDANCDVVSSVICFVSADNVRKVACIDRGAALVAIVPVLKRTKNRAQASLLL